MENKPLRIYDSIVKTIGKIIMQKEEEENIKNLIENITTGDENNNNKSNNIIEYKILVIGERLTGKSSICLRFCLNEFNLEIKPSSNTECYLKTLLLFDKEIKLYLVDMDISNVNNQKEGLFKDVSGLLLIFDITKQKSFEKIDDFLKVAKEKVGNNIPTMLIGNKNDLKFLRNVDFEEATDKAAALGADFRETNCIEKEAVKEAVMYLVAKIYYNELDERQKEEVKKMLGEEE